MNIQVSGKLVSGRGGSGMPTEATIQLPEVDTKLFKTGDEVWVRGKVGYPHEKGWRVCFEGESDWLWGDMLNIIAHFPQEQPKEDKIEEIAMIYSDIPSKVQAIAEKLNELIRAVNELRGHR